MARPHARLGSLAGCLLAISACGPADNDPGPGGVTVGEARALDEAAEMLEQRRLPPEALPDGAVPEDAPTPPSGAAAEPRDEGAAE